MRVAGAKAVLSHETACAIKVGIETNLKGFKPEHITTAFFCECVGRWWEIMDNRRSKLVFSKNNQQAFDDNIEFLKWFAQFYSSMKIHTNQGQGLKPSQSGVLISTFSMINLVTQLMEEGHDLVYTSKTSQNALGKYLNCNCFL